MSLTKVSYSMITGAPISVLDYGADPTGATDSTTAIQTAVNYCIANNKFLNIPFGSYLIDMITFKDAVYGMSVSCDNALFLGNAAVTRAGMFEVVNCVDFNMLGSYQFIGQDNANYDAGIYIRAQTGTSQSTTRVNIYNPCFRNLKVGVANGVYTVDHQCSEINIFGANFFKCPIAAYNAGSNTGIQFIGSNLVSEANAAFPTIPEKAIWIEGGFVKVVGGSIVTNPTSTYAILFNPCQSALYSANLYGTLNVVGAHVEVNSGLLQVANNRALAAPDSTASNITFSACTGFAGAPAATDFATVSDTTYLGVLTFTANNWYSSVVRTGFNVSSAAALAVVNTDSVSFGKNFKNWMTGVSGGILKHGAAPVLNVFNLAARTIPAGTTEVLKFSSVSTTGDLGRYSGRYDAGTGTFTVGTGGFNSLTVNSSVQYTGGGPCDFILKKNGATFALGSTAVGFATLSCTLFDLVAGDVITVSLAAYTNPAALGTGSTVYLQLTGATQ